MRVFGRYLFVAFGGRGALSSGQCTSAVEVSQRALEAATKPTSTARQLSHKIFWALAGPRIGWAHIAGALGSALGSPLPRCCPVCSGLSGRDLLVGFPLRRRISLCNWGTIDRGPLTWGGFLVTSATAVTRTHWQVTAARLRSLHLPTSSLPLSAANAYETPGGKNEADSIVHGLQTCKDQSGFVL